MIKEHFKILCIDGGGVRGIYPTVLLKNMEDELQTPLHKYFDLIIGASTGGIIALGIAMGIPAKEIYDFYKKRLPLIFKRSWRNIQGGFFLPKYSGRELELALKDIFGETLLSEAKARVCIPSIDGINGKIKVFKTRHLEEYVLDNKMKVWKIAMATSAAPYFLPAFNATFNTSELSFIDGGLWANNPTLIGIAEANRLGYSTENIKVLSMGTGTSIFKREKWKLKYGLAISWGPKILDLVFNAQAQAIENEARYLISNDNYIRVTFPLDTELILDDVKSIPTLEQFAERDKFIFMQQVESTFFIKTVPPFIPIP